MKYVVEAMSSSLHTVIVHYVECHVQIFVELTWS